MTVLTGLHMRISVVGGGVGTDAARSMAERVGVTIAERGHTLVCGGRGGVMQAACRGAKESAGRTIGILPGEDIAAANPHVDIPIATGIGDARNVLVALNGDGMIALDGQYGTLSEIALGLNIDRPVAGIDTHDVAGIHVVETPETAVDVLESEWDGHST